MKWRFWDGQYSWDALGQERCDVFKPDVESHEFRADFKRFFLRIRNMHAQGPFDSRPSQAVSLNVCISQFHSRLLSSSFCRVYPLSIGVFVQILSTSTEEIV